jgi:integrase
MLHMLTARSPPLPQPAPGVGAAPHADGDRRPFGRTAGCLCEPPSAARAQARTIQRTLNIGKAAISRAFRRCELAAMPFVLSVSVTSHPPKGRPMEVVEVSRLYEASAPHVPTFIRWMIGTAARPGAILQLRAEQVEWTRGIIRLKKYRPVVKLPTALTSEHFEGWLISCQGGDGPDCITTAWRAAVRRSGLTGAVRPYSLRHTAARWMRQHGVSAEEVAPQLGHRRLGVRGLHRVRPGVPEGGLWRS